MFRKHPLCAVILLLITLILVAFVVTGIVIMTFSAPGGEVDWLLVLGTTVDGTEPSPMLADRISAAYTYLCEHPDVTAVLTGGKGDENNLSEAECMFNELTAMGVDPARLRIEDRATSTVENFSFSLNLIEEETGSRPERVGVLSSEFHLLRANLFAKREGITAVTIPAKTSDPGVFWSYFIREIVLVWYYSVLG